jgi:2-methylaconitate cis-trans-isomerase PrpF
MPTDDDDPQAVQAQHVEQQYVVLVKQHEHEALVAASIAADDAAAYDRAILDVFAADPTTYDVTITHDDGRIDHAARIGHPDDSAAAAVLIEGHGFQRVVVREPHASGYRVRYL